MYLILIYCTGAELELRCTVLFCTALSCYVQPCLVLIRILDVKQIVHIEAYQMDVCFISRYEEK